MDPLIVLQARILQQIATEGAFKCPAHNCPYSPGTFDDLGKRQVIKQGPWTFVWQPMSDFHLKRNLIYFMIQNQDKTIDLKKVLRKFKKDKVVIDKLLTDSCNEFLDLTKGQWMMRVNPDDADSLCQFREDWHIKNNQLRTCKEIFHLADCETASWVPHKLKAFLQEHDAYSPNLWEFNTIDNDKFIEKLRNGSSYCVRDSDDIGLTLDKETLEIIKALHAATNRARNSDT